MPKCDTCRFLVEPKNEDHAKYYFVCSVPVKLPANLHFWDRESLEGKELGADRWITKKIVNEKPEMLKDCDMHEARQ